MKKKDLKEGPNGRNGLNRLPLDQFAQASRAENIYEVVRSALLAGHWVPGERIDDKELADNLSVSRLSVREALSKLVEIRILEKRHWKGFQVRKLSRQEIDSIIEIRESLEILAIRKVVRHFTPRLDYELEKSLQDAEMDLRSKDVASFLRSDFSFHEILYRSSENIWLSDILKNLRILIDLIRSIIQATDFEEVAKASLEEHREILKALRAGDEAAAVNAVVRHIVNHRKRIKSRPGYAELG